MRLLIVALLAVSCTGTDGPPPPSPTPPIAPVQNDPAFAVAGLRTWYLAGNAITAGNDQAIVDVVAPAGVQYVDAWFGPLPGVRLVPQPDGHLRQQLDISSLAPGRYDVLFAADSSDTAFAKVTVNRSAPLYVLVSTDYDFPDPSDSALQAMDALHRQHPHLLITHFMSPYTFTDPTVTPERAQAIAAWWRNARDADGDELGLHIHPYCSFVEAAGLPCHTTPSVEYANGDTSGYTVELASYDETDMTTLLHEADTLFAQNQLGKPITFRAGAWTASIETLRALAGDGFVADTSALNWAKVEEWQNVGNMELWSWNMTHWAPIGDASQPWYPNHDDILSKDPPPITTLEVPDNGAMADYVSVQEMEDILAHNWDGGPLTAPVTYSIGFHPSDTFAGGLSTRVDGILDVLDTELAIADNGPLVYETLHQMPAVFTK